MRHYRAPITRLRAGPLSVPPGTRVPGAPTRPLSPHNPEQPQGTDLHLRSRLIGFVLCAADAVVTDCSGDADLRARLTAM